MHHPLAPLIGDHGCLVAVVSALLESETSLAHLSLTEMAETPAGSRRNAEPYLFAPAGISAIVVTMYLRRDRWRNGTRERN
jgi:hypothetical protein